MPTKTVDLWHCTSPQCGREVSVESGGEAPASRPRCACGAVMKKKYVSPALSYLEFLRVEEPVASRGGTRGE